MDGKAMQIVQETTEGIIRIYGANALLRADFIVARMEKLREEKGAVLWREIAETVKRMSPSEVCLV